VVHEVPVGSAPATDAGGCCIAGTHYFRVWLAEMHLARDREWFASRHPAVHSVVRIRFGDEDLELPRVSGALGVPGVEATRPGGVVHLDHPLTPLLPYNGGIVEISAGLLALEGAPVLADFVSAVDAVSQVLLQPPLSSALAAVLPVTRAVQTLLGAAPATQHLGVHVAYAGTELPTALHAGYVVVMRAERSQVNPSGLAVEAGRLRHHGQPLTGVDYLLFRIERMAERDDWDGLSSIARPLHGALAALGHGNVPMAEALVRQAVLEAFTSADLTRADRTRVAGEIKRAYQDARDAGMGLTPAATTLSAAMAGAPPIDTYARRQPPSLTSLLDLDH
jgi:hypothetical protein